jgi:hypothetical protein
MAPFSLSWFSGQQAISKIGDNAQESRQQAGFHIHYYKNQGVQQGKSRSAVALLQAPG